MRFCVILLGLLAACGKEQPAPPPAVEKAVEEPVPQTLTEPAAPDEKPAIRKSKYDPPTDIPHLEDTPPRLREKIDFYVGMMFDPWAGRDSTDAKHELINIGKPAFPRILARMAAVRDTITDIDSDEERRIESSLKLADEALREMDGYLTEHAKPVLRPGSEKRYIAYICRLHYKRWVATLKDLRKMPGPYLPQTDSGDWDRAFVIAELLKSWTYEELRAARWSGDKDAAASMLKELFAASASTIDYLPRNAMPLLESIPPSMKEQRSARKQIGPVLADGLAHDSLHLRKLAVECLRVLYEKRVEYRPNAPPARRDEKIRRWREVIEAADR